MAGFDAKRTVPSLARWVGNKYRNTAAIALDAMQTIFELCDSSEQFFQYAGKLDDKQKTILDGRFKFQAAKRARPASAPAETTTAAKAEESASDTAPTGGARTAWEDSTTSRVVAASTSEAQKMLQSMDFYTYLQSAELEQRVMGHKLLLVKMEKEPEAVVPIANELVAMVTKTMEALRPRPKGPSLPRNLSFCQRLGRILGARSRCRAS